MHRDPDEVMCIISDVNIIIAEARPDLQGGRICAWEAVQSGIHTSVCVDAAVGHVLTNNNIGCVIVDAQRVAANGDVAANIGTLTVCAAAAKHIQC